MTSVDIPFSPFPFNNININCFLRIVSRLIPAAYGDKTCFLLLFALSKIQSRQRNEIFPSRPRPYAIIIIVAMKTVKFLHVYHIRSYCATSRVSYTFVQSIVFGNVAIVSWPPIDEYQCAIRRVVALERSKNQTPRQQSGNVRKKLFMREGGEPICTRHQWATHTCTPRPFRMSANIAIYHTNIYMFYICCTRIQARWRFYRFPAICVVNRFFFCNENVFFNFFFFLLHRFRSGGKGGGGDNVVLSLVTVLVLN